MVSPVLYVECFLYVCLVDLFFSKILHRCANICRLLIWKIFFNFDFFSYSMIMFSQIE